jgi:hypothetical protein
LAAKKWRVFHLPRKCGFDWVLFPMDMAFNPADLIDAALRQAATAAGLPGDEFDPVVRPADPRFGDYQANGVLPFAKRNKRNPREVATAILEAAQRENLLDPRAWNGPSPARDSSISP